MTTPTRDPRPDAWSGTRGDFSALVDRLVNAAWTYASPAGSLMRFPGPPSASGAWSDGLEGYARTFLAAAFRSATGEDPSDHLARYAEGLIAGVDPDHAERWPRFDERRQAIPEAASIAIALHETRDRVWNHLPERSRQQTVDWMSQVLGRSDFRSNWLWFQNVIETFLQSVGAPIEQADLDRNAAFAEGLYVSDGWYSDGRGRDGERQSFDWYAGWAWHVYPLLEARIRGAALSDTHRERLAAYLGEARDLIGLRGEPVMFGRSAAYRFAVLAPFWAGALASATPLAAGETRELAARTVGHFLESRSIDANGLLPIGWHGAFPLIRQPYTGGSSPFWASKAFLGLLLPDNDQEWTTPAVLEPVEVTRAHVAPGWLVVSTPGDGIVRLLNHGSDRMYESRLAPRADDPFYRRTGYSNVTSPQLGSDAVANPRDSHTTLLNVAGRAAHRDGIERMHLTDSVAVSRSRVHWLDASSVDHAGWAGIALGPRMTVASVVSGTAELRLAWWRAAPEPTGNSATTTELDADAVWPRDPGPWRVSFGGWSLANPISARPGEVASPRATSRILGLGPVDRLEIIEREGADPFGTTSVTPVAVSTVPLVEAHLAAALVQLTGDDEAPSPPRIEVNAGGSVDVTWPDGRVDIVPTDGRLTW